MRHSHPFATNNYGLLFSDHGRRIWGQGQNYFLGEIVATGLKKRIARTLAAAGVSTGILVGIAIPSQAAIDGWSWNWSNWWDAHAYVEIYNPGICRQSVARIGDNWSFGERSRKESKAEAHGFNFTHQAYQRGC